MKKYFIAIDSDGTIRNDEGLISDNTINIIKKFNRNGSLVVLASSRPRYHLRKIAEQLEINYIISNNGAEIFDIKNDEVLFSNFIKRDTVVKIYNFSLKHNIRLVISINELEYVTKNIITDKQVLIDSIEMIDINKVKQILIQWEDCKDLELLDNFINQQDDISVVNKSLRKNWYSIGDKKTNKGNAINKLVGILNFSYDDIITIGNDENDISMFEVATISCAVNNSSNKVKEQASLVIDSNNEEGIYKFLSGLE